MRDIVWSVLSVSESVEIMFFLVYCSIKWEQLFFFVVSVLSKNFFFCIRF